MPIRSLIIISILIFLMAFNYSQQAQANYEASDPLVTKSYVDQYLTRAFGQIKEQIAYLESQTKNIQQRMHKLEAQLIEPIIFTIGNVEARQGDEKITLPQAPYTKEGRTMLPFRLIGETMGARVGWDGTNRQVSFQRKDRLVVLTIGSTQAQVNGETINLDVSPELVASTTMVPLRFIVDALGARLDWLPDTKEVIVYP